MTREKITDLIEKVEQLQFFNQRAGRELWGEKPKEIQNIDIANADTVFEELKKVLSALSDSDNKGEWIPVIDSYYEDGTQKESHWECSKCGSGRSGWGEFKFCPDCGADMRGEE